ncbi:MAG: cation transporter [Clostridia bacterium]|nr:cation transporter [Clostridia bacterium]
MENVSQKQTADRNRLIVRTSFIGIAANVLLAAFKAAVGLLANSISVVLDAVNNLTDALSSIITIIGARYAEKPADKKHPLGHGRAEYLSAMIVAALVLYAGITALVESVKKIFDRQDATYSIVSLVVLAAAIVVKLLLGSYVRRMGERARSDALKASGSDALFDAVLSGSVLLSAILKRQTGISLEAWVGVVISAVIIKSGVEMLQETLNELLGKRADRELVHAVQETICENPRVYGAYDLILHSYGPDKMVGSVHVEVDDTLTATEIDRLERQISAEVYRAHGIIMSGIGIYAVNTTSPLVQEMRQRAEDILKGYPGVLQTHGFHVDEENRSLSMDVILDFELPDRQAQFRDISQAFRDAFPGWNIMLTLDLDV